MRSFEIDWWPKRVISGVGAVERLGPVLAELGRRRAIILCGKSIAAGEAIALVRRALGDALVAEAHDVEMHAPLTSLGRAVDRIEESRADAVISIGGGSAIDSGKGVSLLHAVGAALPSFAMRAGGSGAAMPPLRLAHVAIPTTTGSGSEVSPTCGLRDPAAGHKRIFRDERLIPDVAILDPRMAVAAPVRLSACSGMTAVARSVEALYSERRNPIRTALALHALGLLIRALPASIDRPTDLDARGECLAASAMSAIAANVNTSAVHAIGHVVGGRYGLQHGIPHAILLAAGMRHMLPRIGDDQKLVLHALGGGTEGLDAETAGRLSADCMERFVAALPIPHRLREVGVPESDLDDIADHASRDPILLNSGASLDARQISDLLRLAY